MLRIVAILLLLFLCSGCVALTAVSAIPGALFEVVANQFIGEEKSFPSNMRKTLAAAQRTLWELQLDIDVLEIQPDGGYGVGFGNERLDGEITLRKQTVQLTTVYVKAKGNTREESVEQAIIEMIGSKLKKLPKGERFNPSTYNNLRQKPDAKSKHLGWFRPGANLEASRSGDREWLKIKLPSGKVAFLKGSIINDDEKQKRKAIQSQSE